MRLLIFALLILVSCSSETNKNILITALKCEIRNTPPEVVIIIDKKRELWTFYGTDDSLRWDEKIDAPSIFYPPRKLILSPDVYSYVYNNKPMIRIGPTSAEDEIDYDWIERDTLVRRGWSDGANGGDRCEIHPVPKEYSAFIKEYDFKMHE